MFPKQIESSSKVARKYEISFPHEQVYGRATPFQWLEKLQKYFIILEFYVCFISMYTCIYINYDEGMLQHR